MIANLVQNKLRKKHCPVFLPPRQRYSAQEQTYPGIHAAQSAKIGGALSRKNK